MQQLHTKAWLCGLCAQMIMSSAPDCEIAVIKEVPKEAAARTPTQKRQSPLRRFHEGTLTFTFGVFGALIFFAFAAVSSTLRTTSFPNPATRRVARTVFRSSSFMPSIPFGRSALGNGTATSSSSTTSFCSGTGACEETFFHSLSQSTLLGSSMGPRLIINVLRPRTAATGDLPPPRAKPLAWAARPSTRPSSTANRSMIPTLFTALLSTATPLLTAPPPARPLAAPGRRLPPCVEAARAPGNRTLRFSRRAAAAQLLRRRVR
mmetsp:Transcript_13929/g.41463  ORF Transcript_13929/g.41463 Transcript_13929/m.41463 type:complete len:263 (-) Transcript_13929:84-872(-)